jgi:hypothetical protein
MADRKEDRHRLQRHYQSGAQKRKDTSEKEKSFEQLLSKIPKMSNYFSIHRNTQTSPSEVPFLTSDHNDNSSSSTIPSESKMHDSPSTSNTHYVPENFLLDSDTAKETGEENNIFQEITSTTLIDSEVSLRNPNYQNDIGLWVGPFTDDEINYWMRKGSTDLQQCDEKLFSVSSVCQERKDGATFRKCSKNLFFRILKNKELVNRSWLCFSPLTGKVYCYVCKLMTVYRTIVLPNNNFSGDGYCDWKHAAERISQHELSKNHLNSIVNFSRRSNEISRIDQLLKKQVCNFSIYTCL